MVPLPSPPHLSHPSDYIATNAEESLKLAVPHETSPFVLGLREAARTNGVAVHVGIHDVATHQADAKRLLNRNLYITSEGIVDGSATYDKLHVFDYGSLRESATVQPGGSLTRPFASPVGRVGSLICFDLRFPEAALSLAQPGRRSRWRDSPAQVVTFPSAFTLRTGAAHWETLLRARAVETQSWVVAAAQVGRHTATRASYGRSMVVDPWGRVVLRLKGVKGDAAPEGTPEGEAEDGAVGEIGFVDIDIDEVERIRREMPLQRRV
ncbi:deaminated glutathione amidase [Geosmithia morbida]|uniref:Deaminated glutathione amidase n=1 Tax=Geosmithia morbida TaxID=1094350 RepID=A0A9P5D2H7_9HYPO|nr:deaminated glutathione amidase [Geosmithia morbida]KAF4123872.1 deaminated glutathione amidase [Geosmithia morbida]